MHAGEFVSYNLVENSFQNLLRRVLVSIYPGSQFILLIFLGIVFLIPRKVLNTNSTILDDSI